MHECTTRSGFNQIIFHIFDADIAKIPKNNFSITFGMILLLRGNIKMDKLFITSYRRASVANTPAQQSSGLHMYSHIEMNTHMTVFLISAASFTL